MTIEDATGRTAARSALALVLALATLSALAIAGCGGARPSRAASSGEAEGARTQSTAGADDGGYEADSASVVSEAEIPQPAAMGSGSSASGVRLRDPLVAVPRPEPSPWDARDWALAPAVPQRVLLATIELPPGEAFRPPATTCQDVIVFVRDGQLEATGTGVAPSDAPVTLYPGDAVRFGAEGDGIAINVGARPARTVMAVARRPGTGPARVPAPPGDDCSLAAAHTDPLMRPLRVASVATTAPLLAAAGRLEVRILLDTEGAGARHGALSYLDGAPDLVIPEHLHHGAAEILLVEDGEGTMRVGDRTIAVRPGSALYIPEDTLHSFRGAGTRPLRAIQVYSPAGPEQASRPGDSRAATR